MSTLLTTRLTTTAVDARDGFDYWNDAVSSTFVPLECRSAFRATFRGEIVNVSVGDVQFTKVTAASHRVRRTRPTIARNDPELIKICVQLYGTGRISQDGRDAELHPGDLTMYDTSRPYTLSFDADRRSAPWWSCSPASSWACRRTTSGGSPRSASAAVTGSAPWCRRSSSPSPRPPAPTATCSVRGSARTCCRCSRRCTGSGSTSARANPSA